MTVQNFTIDQPPRLELDEFIPLMSGRNRPALQRILDEHRELFRIAPGSRKNHHAWQGGYWDHVTECLNLAVSHYTLWNSMRTRPYELWEALEVLFLHDIEKPWKYCKGAAAPIAIPDLATKPARAQFRLEFLNYYEIKLNDRQQNALQYTEGIISDYNPELRVMQPLAHLCHTCDETSARQWPDYPLIDDEWRGATRTQAA